MKSSFGLAKLKVFWRDLSVSKKLYSIVGIMAVLVSLEIILLRFSIQQLSGIRAFVNAEGSWSKSQKNAYISMLNYVRTKDPGDYQQFLDYIDVPLGDRLVKQEILTQKFREEIMLKGYIQGQVHPEDIDNVIFLSQYARDLPYVGDAINTWFKGDDLLDDFIAESEKLKTLVDTNASEQIIDSQLAKLNRSNDEMTLLQYQFSQQLGKASRWAEGAFILCILFLVITIELTGFLLTINFGRKMKTGLLKLKDAAEQIGKGNYNIYVQNESKDELGQLSQAINQTALLVKSKTEDKKVAEKASATKSAFLANMSHEIRTPLNAILGFTEVLSQNNIPQSERAKFHEIIKRNGKALAQIINDILDLSKVEAGQLQLEYKYFSLKLLLSDITHLFKPQTEAKGISLKVNYIDPNIDFIKSDITRMRQIIFNLIANAVKFTEKGEVLVEVDFKDSILFISVTDTGVGLSEENKEKIFDAFSQAEESTTRRFGGTGLGLTISKQLAKLLGGDVTLDHTQINKGSKFTFYFPTAHISGDSDAKSPESFAHNTIVNESLRLLFVDDSHDNQRLIKAYLSQFDFQMQFAFNGQEAMEILEKKDFDLIFMDLQMPVMDGFTCLQRIKEKKISTPVIALTAHALIEEQKKSEEAGFVTHLTKPITQKDLLTSIQQFT